MGADRQEGTYFTLNACGVLSASSKLLLSENSVFSTSRECEFFPLRDEDIALYVPIISLVLQA